MSDVKKVLLDDKTQETLWKLIRSEQEVVTEVFGTEVRLTVLAASDDDQQEVIKEIESDPQLQRMLLESEEDEKKGLIFSSAEAIHFIREHHSK